ncbi:MAG: ATP-binding protein [Candidatus Omnitrophota bacterium]|nr:ATP-binding protein [Candidatus Omnitrophota bacterium]
MIQLQLSSVSIAIIINILLGLFVYFKNPKKWVNLSFVLMTFSVALWNAGDVLIAFSKDSSIAIIWSRISYVGAVFFPTFSIHFVVSIIRDVVHKNWKKVLIVTYASTIFLLCFIFTPFIIKGVMLKPFKEIPGPLYFLFILFFMSCFAYLFYILIKALKKSTGLKRTQLGYVLLGYFTGAIAGLIYFLILQGFNIPPIHYIVEIGYTLVVSYAIIKYRLMNIRSAVTRAGVFAFVYTVVLAIPFIVGGIIKTHISSVSSNWWIIPLLTGIVLASAGPFIYIGLQRRFESRLRAMEFKSHEALRRLSHNMLRFTNLNVLLRLMVHYLVKVLKLRFAAIYLFDKQNERYILSSVWYSGENVELPQEFEVNSYLVEYMHLKKLPVVAEELSLYAPVSLASKIGKLSSDLSAIKINTAIPSFLRNNLIGFLILSDRRRKNIPFTQEDLNFLMVLSNEAALAIENAQFHQKEVSTLVEKSKREALADMAPGASHQFNNRLASISSSVELLLFKMENFNIEAHYDEKTRALLKDTKETLELIDNEVYKGKEITSAILKRAKAKVEFQEFDLPTLIENTYKLVMISRSRSGLDRAKELKFNIVCLNKIPDIFASEALLQDVFYNLIDNAYDAIQDKARLMSQGGNSFYQGDIEVSLSQEGNIIVAKVKDNGIGLTKENHRKLFTPYFTTKATSNKGSGLGLCVIRDFIEMHKGAIACDSEYDKGATFTIRLPIKKEKIHGT